MSEIDIVPLLQAELKHGNFHDRVTRNRVEYAIAEIERLRTALKKIIAIEDKEWGTDWVEIEEARKIASYALSGETVETGDKEMRKG